MHYEILSGQTKKGNKKAGDGNRTHVSSLEGWCSTIELHPHVVGVTGFEPATSWSQTRRSSQAEPHPEAASHRNLRQRRCNYNLVFFYLSREKLQNSYVCTTCFTPEPLSQICNGKMYFFLSIDLHNGIRRLTSFLSWIRQASGIHRDDIVIDIDHRAVCMSIQYNIHTTINGFFFDRLIPHGDIIIMSMSHPYLIGSDIQGDLSGKIRKKIVIPQHNICLLYTSPSPRDTR